MLFSGNVFQLAAIEEKLEALTKNAEANSPHQLQYNQDCAEFIELLSEQVARDGRENRYVQSQILTARLSNLESFESLKRAKSTLDNMISPTALQDIHGGSLENIVLFGVICFGTRFIEEWISPFLFFSLIREGMLNKLKKCTTLREMLETINENNPSKIVDLVSESLVKEQEKITFHSLKCPIPDGRSTLRWEINFENLDELTLNPPFTFSIETLSKDIEFAFTNKAQMLAFCEMFAEMTILSSSNSVERSKRISRAPSPSNINLQDLIGSSTNDLIGISLEHHAREVFKDYQPGILTKSPEHPPNQKAPENETQINPNPVIDRTLKMAILYGIINPGEIDAGKCRLGPSGQKVIVVNKEGTRIKAIDVST